MAKRRSRTTRLRSEPAWASFVLIAALCAVFVGAVHGYDGQGASLGYDWVEQITFYKDFLGEAWQKGEFPLWCPYVFGGRPFAADPTTQCFYPATLMWILLPKLTAYTLDTLLHYILAGCFAFLYLRALDVRATFSAMGGLLFTLSGFNANHMLFGHLNFHAAVAWLPLVFWCVEKAVGGQRVFWLWGGGVLGLQFLAGAIQVSWMSFLFGGLYAVVRSAYPWRTRRFAEGLAGFGVMAALGTGISAVQLLPTAEFASLGVRNPRSYAYSIQNELPPQNFLNLLYPQARIAGPHVSKHLKLIPEGEFGGYMGIVTLGLAVAGFIFVRRRPPVAGLAALVVLALPLMLGDFTPLFRLLWWVVPGVAYLRTHSREILLLLFAFISAGMVALEEFARAGEKLAPPRQGEVREPGDRSLDGALWAGVAFLGVFAAVAFLTFAFAAPFLTFGGKPAVPPWQTAFILLSFPALWIARRRAGVRTVAFGLLAFAFLDVTVTAAAQFHRGYPYLKMEEQIASVVKEDGGLFRGHFHKRAYRRERFISDRFSGVDGYSGMVPRRWYELIHALSDTPIKDELVNEVSQETLFKRATTFPFRVLNVKYTTEQQADRSYRLVVNPDPDPRAWLAAEALVVPDDTDATALLKSSSFDPGKTAILDAEPPADIARPGSAATGMRADPALRSLSKDGRFSTSEAGSCRVLDWNLNGQRLEVTTSHSAILVVSEGWFPGWTVSVDGADVPLYRADVTLRGVAVPAGVHEVVFRYRPRSVRLGAIVSFLSVGALVGGVFLLRRCDRAVPPPEES